MPNSHLTAAIVIACFSAIALFAGFALPQMSKHKLSAKIQQDACLTRENARHWAEIPGVRDIEHTKTFTFMNMNTDTLGLLLGSLDAVQVKNATYNYKYKYKDLLFAPASNDSVQFHKAYTHEYTDGNEDELKSLMIQTLNIGAFKGAALQASLSRAQTFIQSLFRIYTSFQDNILTLLISNYASLFYISNQTLTNETIFMYNDTVTPLQSENLWNDLDYGWSKPETLMAWVDIAAGYIGNPSYQPSMNPHYSVLKIHFGLTDEQMIKLIGTTPQGQVGPSSVLYTVISAVQSTISAYNHCAMAGYCNSVELFAIQFFEAGITKNPVFPGMKAHDSIAELNQTFPVPPEIAAVTHGKDVPFGQVLANKLFDISADRSSPAETQQTLFKIQNVEMIIANQKDAQAVADYFDLENVDQAQVLIDYVNYIVDQFAYQGKTNTKALKYTADVTSSNMNRLLSEFSSLLTVNVTAIGTFTTTQKNKLHCDDLLADIQATAELIEKICKNPDTTLDTAIGQAPWVSAYLNGPGSSAYEYLETTTTISDDDLQKLLSQDSQLGKTIKEVTDAIVASLKCEQTPCDPTYSAKIQWATSEYTLGLPADYFDGKTYESLVDVFPEHFKTFIPEPSVLIKRKFKTSELKLDYETAEKYYSYGFGSINNNYELLKLFSLSDAGDYAAIKTRFGMDQEEVAAFAFYFDEMLAEYYLGGVLINISAYDLLWGYEDPFLKRLNSSNFFENIQLFDTKISLFGEKENKEGGIISMINSGFDDPNLLRAITSRDGNLTLSLKKTFFDGNNYISHFESPWVGDLEYITGTDGSGFRTLLDEGDSISIFEDRFLRNVQYNYDTQETYDNTEYVFNRYKLDSNQFVSSERYTNQWGGFMNLTGLDNTPVLVSLPYFTGCPLEVYRDMTFDGKKPSEYQDKVNPGGFVVEALTGKTVSFNKNYQYSVSNVFPYFLRRINTPTPIPIVTVTESYRTSNKNFDGDLKSYYQNKKTTKITMIVTLSVAGILGLLALVFLKKSFSKDKHANTSTVFHNSGQNYSGLRVESDGGDSLYQRA